MSRAGVAMLAHAALGSALVVIATTPNYFGVRGAKHPHTPWDRRTRAQEGR
jgi:hypothetical protein